MTWTDLARRPQSPLLPPRVPGRRLRARLLAALIPAVAVIWLAAGGTVSLVSQRALQATRERLGTLQTQALGQALEQALAQARRDLLFAAALAPRPEPLAAGLERANLLGPLVYRELGYLDLEGHDHVFFVASHGRAVRLPNEDLDGMRPSLFRLLDQGPDLAPGQVGLSPLVRPDAQPAQAQAADQAGAEEVFRLYAPRADATGKVRGLYVLGLCARSLRDILSRHDADRAPPPDSEGGSGRSFLFDTEGWMLLQADEADKPQPELTTALARSGYAGTQGRRGMEAAFRPESRHKRYWEMVEAVREGRGGISERPGLAGPDRDETENRPMPYAPVRFWASADAPPRVVAGVAVMDMAGLDARPVVWTVGAGFFVVLAACLAAAGLVAVLVQTITRPLTDLSDAVAGLGVAGGLPPLEATDADRETRVFHGALNGLLEVVCRQEEALGDRDRAMQQARLREQASLDRTPPGAAEASFPEIKGAGPLMERLKDDVAKAAQVDADVLITGETGTGKRLVAEAIHRHCHRAARPLIAINCATLDEDLLLDALFGHVRGALAEARADRVGAFQEAEGGIVLLDAIQTVTPRVQLALLRAIATRRARPLGGDRDFAVDVRCIATTTVDLREAIARGAFDEDLYFRLKVISVHIPPLRQHKLSISVLVHHFLKQAEVAAKKPGIGLSRGALAKLMAYDWPGNIRELKRCMLRAAVMTERAIIQDSDIVFDDESLRRDGSDVATPPAPEAGARWPDRVPTPAVDSVRPDLNVRQARVLAFVVGEGVITRSRYQALEASLPQRTAVHDLKDLVEKGLLEKRGNGPATHYVPTEAGLALEALLRQEPRTAPIDLPAGK